MAIPDESARETFQGLLLHSRQNRPQDGPHDLIPVALQAAQQAVERKVLFWYLVSEGDLDFEVFHGATPPVENACSLEGCSPSFLTMSNAIT
jgi:hypothetical protein